MANRQGIERDISEVFKAEQSAELGMCEGRSGASRETVTRADQHHVLRNMACLNQYHPIGIRVLVLPRCTVEGRGKHHQGRHAVRPFLATQQVSKIEIVSKPDRSKCVINRGVMVNAGGEAVYIPRNEKGFKGISRAAGRCHFQRQYGSLGAHKAGNAQSSVKAISDVLEQDGPSEAKPIGAAAAHDTEDGILISFIHYGKSDAVVVIGPIELRRRIGPGLLDLALCTRLCIDISVVGGKKMEKGWRAAHAPCSAIGRIPCSSFRILAHQQSQFREARQDCRYAGGLRVGVTSDDLRLFRPIGRVRKPFHIGGVANYR